MKRLVALLAVVAAVAASAASADSSYCSPSGAYGTREQRSEVLLQIGTAASYFNRYRLCVRGPKSKVCKFFPMRATAAGGSGSTVNWRKNFPTGAERHIPRYVAVQRQDADLHPLTSGSRCGPAASASGRGEGRLTPPISEVGEGAPSGIRTRATALKGL